jgi:hypothetical protein
MTVDENEAIQQDQFMKVLGNTIAYVANEALILAQYEIIQANKFPHLWPENDNGVFDKRMNRVTEHLGGPQEFYLLRDDESPPPADNYPEAVLREVFAVFQRARNSVLRAHMFMTVSILLDEQPEMINLLENPEATAIFTKQAKAAFWEHAETAYIRLSSFWDRVGQVLDFAFFNIRKFDQNGFSAVMDRIHANAAPMNDRMKASGSWNRLRPFQTSEKEDGLKWLIQRRNLFVHSLHLHPVLTEDESMFKSQFNHFDAAHREKLRPRDPKEEVALLLGQLTKACELFSDFLTVVEFSPSRKRDRWS